ncbi:MAG: RNA polymerase sigma factor [Candidatus Aminicenantaceae bacterium]
MEPSTSVSIKILKRALSALHPRYRIPVILKDIEGFSQDEIAQILRIPVGTVKARVSRGRNYLKKELEKFNINNEMLLNNREFENGRA